MTDTEALQAIQAILEDTEWSIDLLWTIASVLAQAGYPLTED